MGNQNKKELLYSAIDAENIDLINKILSKYPELVNQPMTKDCFTTPLSRAVWRGSASIVEELLKVNDLGADVNYSGPTGISSLMWAAKRGHIELIMILIEKGANIQTKSPEGFDCLDWAIIHGQYMTAQYLMKPEIYQQYQSQQSLPFMNYDIIIDNLRDHVEVQQVPNYCEKPKKEEIKLEDPVIDPNETWKQYLKRVMNFEGPPLVERSSLPLQKQPQNRILGKLNSYWNGQNPNPKKSNSLNDEIPLSVKQKENQEIQFLMGKSDQ